MDKTEFLKEMISNTGLSMKAFASEVGIPYTTLRSMLERGIENASVNNVIKVCKALNISIEQLYEMNKSSSLSRDEKKLLSNYNKLNELGKQEANKRIEELTEINRYLAVDEMLATKDIELIPIAAHDDGLTDDEKDFMQKRIEEYEKNK